uniref:Uncharacterized protein n=1 Tax=Neolamprologus brichardi TaxID=32507 RepID=A0A3Q4N4D1_NEOBR
MIVSLWPRWLYHEYMELNCLVSMFQAPAVSLLVLGMFFWHTLTPLIPTSQLYMKVYFH